MNAIAAKVATVAAEKVIEKGVKFATGRTKKTDRPKRKNGPRRKPKPRAQTRRNDRSPIGMGSGATVNPHIGVPAILGRTYPKSFFKRSIGRFRNSDSIVLEGLDYYGTFGTYPNQYYLVFELPLNPIAFPSTRLTVESSLWTKFSFEEVEVVFVPTAGTSASGALLMSHVDDPEIMIGNPGTTAFASALSSVDGAQIHAIYAEMRHTWKPRKSDKREFYIQPDIGDEARFTQQSNILVVQMTADQYNIAGLVYLRYKVHLYEQIVAQNTLQQGAQSGQVTSGTPSSSGPQVQLNDGGATGNLSFTFAVGTSGVAVSTLYAIWINFQFGGARSLEVYWIKTPATLGNPAAVYRNSEDAANGASTGKVPGSFFGSASIPANGRVYWQLITTDPEAKMTLEQRLKKLEALLLKQTVSDDEQSQDEDEIPFVNINSGTSKSTLNTKTPSSGKGKRGVG